MRIIEVLARSERERDFIKQMLFWIILFTFIIIGTGFLIHVHFFSPYLHDVKLDGAAVAALIAAIFASAVPVAGALIVIKIANKQEELTNETKELAKQQVHFAVKQTADYQVAFDNAVQAFYAVKELLALSSVLSATIRRLGNEPEKLFKSKASILHPLLISLHELLKKSWYVTLDQYCKQANEGLKVNFDANFEKLYDAIYTCKLNFEENNNTEKSFDTLNREIIWLLHVVWSIGKTLEDARDSFDIQFNTNEYGSILIKEIKSNDIIKTPETNGFLHQFLMQKIDLGDFYTEATKSVTLHYQQKYSEFDKALIPNNFSYVSEINMEGIFQRSVEEVFTNPKSKIYHYPIRINQQTGASHAINYIKKCLENLSTFKNNFYYLNCGIDRNYFERILKIIYSDNNAFIFIHVASGQDSPDWLFQYHMYLDRCIVLLDNLPMPQWFEKYNKDDFLSSIHKSLKYKSEDETPNRWLTVLKMLSYRASNFTKTNAHDSSFNFPERSTSRVIWIGLNSVPDFRDEDAIKNYDQNRFNNFIDIFESCATTDGGLYYAWI